jgi:cellulose synthase/poly-beta-1,6-N-acetylglucosamine synthase-like glycosyltransferase
MSRLRRWRAMLNHLALPLTLFGLIYVALTNWRSWQRDKVLLEKVKSPPLRPPLAKWPKQPIVSILVAAWNETDLIERHIESFVSLRYPHKELVLCAGGQDGTYTLAKRYEGACVRVLEQKPGEGKQRALARAFPQTKGEIIFLTDADCLLDDDTFERTLYPVASGAEQVATGGSRPLPEQLSNPFVVSQAASQLYANLRNPDYGGGLLGRNTAVHRELLARSRGLEAPAPSGTDYVLAKMLLRAGARIRQNPHSRVATRFPTTAADYMRQQRRWLRNVAIHGIHFGVVDEARAAVQTSLLAALMLLLPFAWPLVGLLALGGWLLLLSHALLARLRYRRVVTPLLRIAWKPGPAEQLRFFVLDLLTWIQPLHDYVRPLWQGGW